MKNYRIAIVRRDLGIFGGIENQILKIAKLILDSEGEVYFFTDNKNSKLARELTSLGVSIEIIRFNFTINCFNNLKRICIKNRIQLIQTHMFKEAMVVSMMRFFYRNVKHVYRVHTYIDCSSISGIKKIAYHIISKLLSFNVDYYISINQFNVDEMVNRSRINIDKISIVSDIVDSIGVPDNLKNRLWPAKKIAMIANFIQGKGHDTLIKGISVLKKKGFLIYVKLIGDSPNGQESFENNIRKLAIELNVIDQLEFCGFRENISEELIDCSIVVLPSDSEGTPNCILEAMSLKKIVIVSRVGGVPEFLKNGINGFYHEPKSPEAFAETLIEALSCSREKMIEISENGFKTWEEFTIENVGPKLKNIYQSVLEKE